jgi:D-3-phosphoglycerate dehydrogenase
VTDGRWFIVDFDSTLVRVEALDVLAAMLVRGNPARAADATAVAEITERAMAGELDFTEALEARLAILRPRREDVAALVELLREELTPSALEQRAFLGTPAVYVMSGGFREWVEPVVAGLGVPAERVLANTLVFETAGEATGFDRANPLSRSGGKAAAVRALALRGEVIVVGDGWTDYEVRAAGAADRFYAFVENVERPRVVERADRVAASFTDLLAQEGLL